MATNYLNIFLLVSLLFLSKFVIFKRRRGTPLRGPPSQSFIYGVQKQVFGLMPPNLAQIYTTWIEQYGAVVSLPWSFGKRRLVVADPKAVAHISAGDTYGYVQSRVITAVFENLLGRGILWAEGDVHRRQRKALSPSFSNTSIKALSHILYDAGHKTKDAWDALIESDPNDTAVIDALKWTRNITLDAIGAAGFSHDFGLLDGKEASIAKAFEAFVSNSGGSFISPSIILLGPVMPWLLRLPLRKIVEMRKLRSSLGGVATDLWQRVKREKEHDESVVTDKSIIGLLIKAEESDSELRMTSEEVLAQMNTLLLAGFATTAASLTWALVELCKHTSKQDKLRKELSQFSADLTYDQVTSASTLPYLDAVVHEILRLHPAVIETNRICTKDDIIPLSTPLTTASGDKVTSIQIAKGTMINIPIYLINTSEAIWGPDAKKFEPERWFKDSEDFTPLHNEIQGHRHLLTFGDGARTCLGKSFALAEFKIILSLLIRNFVFELPRGENTKIGVVRTLMISPQIEGEKDGTVPLIVRRVR